MHNSSEIIAERSRSRPVRPARNGPSSGKCPLSGAGYQPKQHGLTAWVSVEDLVAICCTLLADCWKSEEVMYRSQKLSCVVGQVHSSGASTTTEVAVVHNMRGEGSHTVVAYCKALQC